MATNRNSTIYSNVNVNKYVADARDKGGRLLAIPFEHTVVSGETGGASANVQDSVNLCVLPAYCRVVGLEIKSDNLWASAGVNGTLQIGDSGDDDRYMAASELYTSTAGGPLATEGGAGRSPIAQAGMNYKPTADTIVFATYKVANPTVGKQFKGCFYVIAPGA